MKTTILKKTPTGYDAFVLNKLHEERATPTLHVSIDDVHMERLKQTLLFFNPDAYILTFPGWDTQPYDRISPDRVLVAERLKTLIDLNDNLDKNPIVLTTVAGMTQRLPPRSTFIGLKRTLKLNDKIDINEFTSFLIKIGYNRVDTVREIGEFTVRGGIIDVFPTFEHEPHRIDLFGTTIETIRTFDSITQLTTGRVKTTTLIPANEILLTKTTIDQFRNSYRLSFGLSSTTDDSLYEAVSSGSSYPGMENWLPLFYSKLETLFDYIPNATLYFAHNSWTAVEKREDAILDAFNAREEFSKNKQMKRLLATPYYPLPPNALYLDQSEIEVRDNECFNFHSFEAIDGIDMGGNVGEDFISARKNPNINILDTVATWVKQQQTLNHRIIIAGASEGSRERLQTLLIHHGIDDIQVIDSWKNAQELPITTLSLCTLEITHGFGDDQFTIVSEEDIFGDRLVRRAIKSKKAENVIAEASSLTVGDLVIHLDHGLGQYQGLETLTINNIPHDCVVLYYRDGDKLFVPVENLEVLSKYGSEQDGIQLDKLGTAAWQARKAKAKDRIREIAAKLMEIAAKRELQSGTSFTPSPGMFDEFCARFPYTETDDQLKVIEETLHDLSSGKCMDRLICGDVGFGKTEVAMRAAFLAAMSGFQVAIVTPTTLLCRQHFLNFQKRFEGFPIKIRQLSRLVTQKDSTKIKREIREGMVDIIIGTQAMLAKDINFKHLGLLIVDEEQHFGVAQKERLKELKNNVHVLTLSATPIPRTLQLALTGVKELSIIATPPMDRLAVRTFTLPYDPFTIKEAILREHYRGGKVFYVCPRRKDLRQLHEKLEKLTPDAKIAVAHGGLTPTELEDVMTAFCDGDYNILLSTNIIESGLDIASANTMIIHRADIFGLSQLYQLRGRVGRGKVRGYCYMTVESGKQLTQTAEKRLHVMQTLDHLGAGFTLASHDLDIRGAGNMVGEEQSGHIKEVGIELYQVMLREAVEAARHKSDEPFTSDWSPTIVMGTSVLIPKDYIKDLNERLILYRRASNLSTKEELDSFAIELVDRFGNLPSEVKNLIDVIEIKQICKKANIAKVDAGPKGAVMSFYQDTFKNPEALIAYLATQSGTVRLRPDHKLVINRAWDTLDKRMNGIKSFLSALYELSMKEQPL